MMYMVWLRNCMAINYAGAGLFADAYVRWLQFAADSWQPAPAAPVEPWLDHVATAIATPSPRRPKLVNCAAGYYSCCLINLGRLAPANDADGAVHSREA